MAKRIILFSALAFLCILTVLSPESSASSVQKGGKFALTPPPPEMALFGFFDPNHDYLLDGTNTIQALGSGKMKAIGDTFAVSSVDTIGVQMTIQRWTGTSWISVYPGSSATSNNAASVYQSYTYQGASGYYYRIVSSHWIYEGAVYESGTKTGGSLLIN